MPTDRSSLIGITLPAERHTLEQHAEWFARFHAVLKKDCGPNWMLSVGVEEYRPQFRMNGFTRPRIRKAFLDAVRFHPPSGHRMCLLTLTYWNEHHVFSIQVYGRLNESNVIISSASVALSFSSACRLDAATRLSWFRSLVNVYPARSGHFTSTAFWDRVKKRLGPPGDGLEWDLYELGWAVYWTEPSRITAVPNGWTVRTDRRGGSMIEIRADQLGSLDRRAIDLGCTLLRADPEWRTRFTRELHWMQR